MTGRSRGLGRTAGMTELVGFDKEIKRSYKTKPKEAAVDKEAKTDQGDHEDVLLTPKGHNQQTKQSRSNQVIKQMTFHQNLIERYSQEDCPSESDGYVSSQN